MVFIYRAQHPERVIFRAGLNPHNPETVRHAVVRFASRVRLFAGGMVMVLVVSASYRLPVEVGQMITAAQERQLQLQQERLKYRLDAETRHIDEMIRALGGPAEYLEYVSSRSERQFIQK